MNDDGANEEAVELVPEKGKEAEANIFFEVGMGRLGHRNNQGCQREIHMLSSRRGAETRSQMLVAKIRKKVSHNKESVRFVGHSSGSDGRGRKDGENPRRGGGYVNPEDLEGARDSDGQTNRRTYKESQHILNLSTPMTARAQNTVRNSTSA